MTRSGNRQLNAAMHRIAVTQIRLDGLGKAYYDKKLAEGKSTHRSPALPQTTPRPHRVQPPHHRPRNTVETRASPAGGLT